MADYVVRNGNQTDLIARLQTTDANGNKTDVGDLTPFSSFTVALIPASGSIPVKEWPDAEVIRNDPEESYVTVRLSTQDDIPQDIYDLVVYGLRTVNPNEETRWLLDCFLQVLPKGRVPTS